MRNSIVDKLLHDLRFFKIQRAGHPARENDRLKYFICMSLRIRQITIHNNPMRTRYFDPTDSNRTDLQLGAAEHIHRGNRLNLFKAVCKEHINHIKIPPSIIQVKAPNRRLSASTATAPPLGKGDTASQKRQCPPG